MTKAVRAFPCALCTVVGLCGGEERDRTVDQAVRTVRDRTDRSHESVYLLFRMTRCRFAGRTERMMQRLLLMMLVAVAALRPAVCATVDGIPVADRVQLGGTTLVLNGAGTRTRFFFKFYIAALYLPSRISAATAVLADAGPKRVSLTMMRHLTSGQFVGALHEAIAHNSTPAEIAQMKPQIDALMTAMSAAGAINEGDMLTIDFLPDGTTLVGRNGRSQGAPIAGRNFQRALLDVWIGPIPVQADLKVKLLGG